MTDLATTDLVRTERLVLHPLPLPVLDAVLSGDLDAARALVPYDITETTFAEDEYVLGLRQAQLRADPGELPWLYRAAVLSGTRQVVARGGFHAPPDDEGSVEIGYSVQPDQRGRGLATELARGLLGWAAAQGAARCVASVRPDNAASLVVVDRLGFVRTGEEMDEIDGLEWVFTREL